MVLDKSLFAFMGWKDAIEVSSSHHKSFRSPIKRYRHAILG